MTQGSGWGSPLAQLAHALDDRLATARDGQPLDTVVKFRFEDPISSHGIKDGIRLTGGHHRTAEIARRIKAGELSPDTKVHLLLHD